MGIVRDKILETAHALVDSPAGVRNPDRRSNVGRVLFELYLWQELGKEAEDQLKSLWAKAVEEGLIKEDDHYRNLGPGETIAGESDSFSVLMKVSKARKSLDKEAFLSAVAKKAKIARPALDELWESCSKEGRASLSKRVLEV